MAHSYNRFSGNRFSGNRFSGNRFSGEVRDPMKAAMLSIVPGLGQYYNGDSRKGFLFLDVAIINYILLSVILLAPNISQTLTELGHVNKMAVNATLVQLLQHIRLGTPASLIVIGLVVTFITFAVRDAYDHAMAKKRRAIYKDAIIELNEAASGSYILHASIVVALAVMALFFFIPHPTARQITEIEFIESIVKPETIEKTIKTPVHAKDTTTKESKNFDKTKAINHTPPKATLSKTTSTVNKTSQKTNNTSNPSSSSKSADSSPSSSAPASQKTLKDAVARIKPIMPPQQTLLAHAPSLPAMPILKSNPITPPATPAVNTTTPTTKTTQAPPTPPMPRIAPKLTTPTTKTFTPPSVSPLSNLTPAKMTPMPLPTNALSFLPKTLAVQPGAAGTSAATPDLSKMVSGAPAMGSNTGRQSKAMPLTSGSTGGSGQQLQLPGAESLAKVGGGSARDFSPAMPAGGLQTGKGSNQGSSPDLFNKNIGQGRDSNKAGSGTGSGPQPLDKREGSGKAPGSSGNGDVPSPERARGNHNPGIPGLMPTVAPQSGTSNRPLNEPGEGKRNTTPTMAEPDFSAYMAELQRKIKRGWFPPRAPGSIKTQVVFKIHTNGELSDLRIKQSSGIAINDQAALKAVESSAPFKHLPANSPENVDIEFTFDYNVFSGRTF